MSGNANYEAGLRLMALHQDVVGLRIGVEETKKQVDALTGELHAHTVRRHEGQAHWVARQTWVEPVQKGR